MDSEGPNYLSPEQTLREKEVIKKCFNLMRDERSRYEEQAEKLLTNEFFFSKSESYELSYLIQDDRFICNANLQSSLTQIFSIEAPIPHTQGEKIEILIELFAQSEAGLIH
jgi:hypothetical protein